MAHKGGASNLKYMERAIRIFALFAALGCGGCLMNSWQLESYPDEHAFPAAEAAAAVRDEGRILGFIPTLGFKQDEHPASGTPQTEASLVTPAA